MLFIGLTKHVYLAESELNGTPTYVNLDQVKEFYRTNDNESTKLVFKDEDCIFVKETPQDIIRVVSSVQSNSEK